jgi:hypothetical protein
MIGVVIAEADTQGSIVELAIAGDEVAFARIVAAHDDDMARIAFFVCGDLDIRRVRCSEDKRVGRMP